MRISYNWLADLVEEIPVVDALADLLTHAGLEVEAVERLGQGLEKIVVGQVLSKEPVQGSDKLHLCQVDAGTGAPLSIVCGASNYEVGDKVPTALVGATLPGGLRIEARKLRGLDSAGMLCSASELGLADEVDGLLLLDPGLPVGRSIVQALALDDVILTLNATPNRPDWLSHVGVARELVALTGTRLRLPSASPEESGAEASSLISIEIRRPDLCGRYAARVAEGVHVGPSPRWLQARLEACGVRPLGNVVDVTNYVLLETGHPLHAFDLDKIGGARIVVRAAEAEERLVTLDGKERRLAGDDLLIADGSRGLVLAGVMGGAHAEVGVGTSRVMIESAYFDPASVRRSSKRHGLHTESSHRFERGADIGAVEYALDRAAQLIQELAGGSIRRGRVDVHPAPRESKSVRLRHSRLEALLGVSIDVERSRRILESLGFVAAASGEGELRFEVPTFRTDVSREVDLIEEVARIHGYGEIPAALPGASASPAIRSQGERVLERLRGALRAAGLDEVINLSFGDRADFAALMSGGAPGETAPPGSDASKIAGGAGAAPAAGAAASPAAGGAERAVSTQADRLLHGFDDAFLPIKNPLSGALGVMRPTLLAGLLKNAAFNRNRQVERLRLYEEGKVFRPMPGKDSPISEAWHLAGLLDGSRHPASWASDAAATDFFDLKGVVEGALAAVGITAIWEAGDAPCLHPRSAARISAGGRVLGQLGELHPRVAAAFDLPSAVFVFEVSLDAIVQAAQLVPHYAGVPRFPAVLRDLAAVVPKDVPAERLREVLMGPAGEGLVEGAELFDVYQGPQLGEDRKNLAFAIRYRASDRTLKDDEVQRIHQALVDALVREVGAELRA